MPTGFLRPAPMSLQWAEDYSLSDGIFKIKGIEKSDIVDLTLYQFIEKFFKEWNRNPGYDTLLLNGELQCASGTRRSIGDIYAICKYYYPDTTFLEVRKVVLSLLDDINLSSWVCCTINKRVFWFNPSIRKFSHQDHNDEYGWRLNKIIEN